MEWTLSSDGYGTRIVTLRDAIPDWRPVPIEVWHPIETSPIYTDTGKLVHVRNRTIREVFVSLREKLQETGELDEIESFSIFPLIDADEEFPRVWHDIACFPVTGTSEGHYIHVEILGRIGHDGEPTEGTRKLLFLGKTFAGFDHACRVANLCAKFLGA